ncbi:MAG TPA: aminotransferase class I/II-fold pyridoxal phosphate-dependent enzyme [Pricia antarctica]|uniref:Aminotransferase class I/II-fold pyridoxal phosphate-dependent enzyme n=1 Tax=Pricia antarctica TaxID=641691 RepID=A0A831QNT9_9FLAO|nr:aminotransferase class I/II-fold pyridoxal phosphate-dependent enzyme [Pricia antarctica]
MTRLPKKLQDKLVQRDVQNTLRHLPEANNLVDFSSNDYLGLSRDAKLFQRASQLLAERGILQNGATGSRLLSGNHSLYSELEAKLSEFHQTESALVFNSGYDANIGFFGSVPQRGDVVFYDEFIHASIRDGIKMGNAKAYKFKHNDIGDLQRKYQIEFQRRGDDSIEIPKSSTGVVYVITESVFSMDGDSPELKAFVRFCQKNRCHLVVDEAHAVGVFGINGQGLVQTLELHDAVFARIITFGKAVGCHGAAILGSKNLKNYLVNFARSLIYTTAMPPHSLATVLASYENLTASRLTSDEQIAQNQIVNLSETIAYFNHKLKLLHLHLEDASKASSSDDGLDSYFIPSVSAIHCCVLPGNERVRAISEKIQKAGFDVKAILSPTVPKGKERLRICLHSFNTHEEIDNVLQTLSFCIQNP